MGGVFGASNQHNMLPPRGPPGADGRDPRFSANYNEQMGPRKLSNAGMQVVNGENTSQ